MTSQGVVVISFISPERKKQGRLLPIS